MELQAFSTRRKLIYSLIISICYIYQNFYKQFKLYLHSVITRQTDLLNPKIALVHFCYMRNKIKLYLHTLKALMTGAPYNSYERYGCYFFRRNNN